jgi:hydroxypyruvate isomerase
LLAQRKGAAAMLKFDPNLTMLYTELPFLERFDAAAADGFTGVEYRTPYDYPSEVIAERLQQAGLEQVLFNFPTGNWDAGERGLACLPDRVDEFRRSVGVALDYARALGCTQLNCMVGNAPAGADLDLYEATLVDNLRYAAPRLADHGIRLQIEPLNRRDNPTCLLFGTAHFERIFDKVGSDNLYLQYDFYHMQVMQGDLMRTFERLRDRILHVQVAGNPGRHEPDTGEIAYDFIFAELERLGYQHWIGCEYAPAGNTSAGLGWLDKWR